MRNYEPEPKSMQTEPPEDFLFVEEAEYKHEYETGIKNGFYWLTSNRYMLDDAFKLIPIPSAGFRLLGPGAELDNRDRTFVLTKVRKQWPATFMFGRLLALDCSISKSLLTPVLNDLHVVFSEEIHDCKNSPKLWSIIERLNPKHYFCTRFLGLCLATRDVDSYKRVLSSTTFRDIEASTHNRLREQKHEFWNAVGPECGPELCIVQDCSRFRIRNAVRCIRHQYQWGTSRSGSERTIR